MRKGDHGVVNTEGLNQALKQKHFQSVDQLHKDSEGRPEIYLCLLQVLYMRNKGSEPSSLMGKLLL